MPRDQMGPVYRALMEAGRDYGIGHFGTFAVNVMRIEKGFKMWGNEMNLDCTALQAGLDPFIRFTKKVRDLTYICKIFADIILNLKFKKDKSFW